MSISEVMAREFLDCRLRTLLDGMVLSLASPGTLGEFVVVGVSGVCRPAWLLLSVASLSATLALLLMRP